jgi:hypothetical protein
LNDFGLLHESERIAAIMIPFLGAKHLSREKKTNLFVLDHQIHHTLVVLTEGLCLCYEGLTREGRVAAERYKLLRKGFCQDRFLSRLMRVDDGHISYFLAADTP